MRHPIRDLAFNLMWTTSGVCWATWRITPQAYGHRAMKEKQTVADYHRLMLRALPGEALMLGVSVSLDPAAIVERMLTDIDAEQTPMWVDEAAATLDALEDPALGLGRRVHYLSVPLSNPGSKAWTAPVMAATAQVKERISLPRAHPSEKEIQTRLRQAASIERAIPSMFAPRPVSVVEQVWLAGHQQARGLRDIPPETAVEMGDLVTTNGVVLPEPVLDPGAASDEGARVLNPFTRRVLKVSDPTIPDQPASYQALMVMTATPPGGLTFPGSELLSRLDEYGPDIDWAIRLKINSRDAVMRANRKAIRTINDQYEQRQTEQGEIQGVHELDRASKLLADYQSLFATDRLEVEVEHTIILAVGSTDYDTTTEQAKELASALGGADFKFEQPIGTAEDLWWAMHPGVPTTATSRAYAQFTSSGMFSRLVPYTSTRIGGSKGPVIALNTSTARRDVVHLDPAGYPELGKSGSVSATGELGGGKSAFGKTLCSHIVSMGGQLLAVDKDKDGEWAHFARILDPDTAVVVGMQDPEWSMDPLRIMRDPGQAALVAEAFYITLLDLPPDEVKATTLQLVLQSSYLEDHQIDSSQQLLKHLQDGSCELPGADVVANKMLAHKMNIFGRLIFDDSLPPVPDTANVVWRTNEVDLPTRDEMDKEFLFKKLSTRKKFGRAYYRLMMSCAREWAFADKAKPVVFVNDEAYDMFSNDENVRDGEYFVRQGRRYKALLLVLSHDPTDFGSEKMRALIPTRLAFRHTDEDGARACIRFLGIKPDDPEFEHMVEELRTNTSPADPDTGVPLHRRGECYIRDAFGAIGEAKVLLPARADMRAAVLTDPPKSQVTTS